VEEVDLEYIHVLSRSHKRDYKAEETGGKVAKLSQSDNKTLLSLENKRTYICSIYASEGNKRKKKIK